MQPEMNFIFLKQLEYWKNFFSIIVANTSINKK